MTVSRVKELLRVDEVAIKKNLEILNELLTLTDEFLKEAEKMRVELWRIKTTK
jgi:hypothetical protein